MSDAAQPTAGSELRAIPLFASLAPDDLSALRGCMKSQKVSAHQTIFWRGDRGDSLYVILFGRVSVLVPNETGEHVIIDCLGPGSFFGEISLFDAGPRTATIRAIDECALLVLSQADFHAFIRNHPAAAIHILTVMGQRQRASTESLRGIKNPNLAFAQSRTTLWQRVSDVIAAVAASQWFTLFHLTWFGAWIGLNLLASLELLPAKLGFDPFPFGLLTMVVSLEAIFLSIFVMVSQNRQSERDRIQIDMDYQVNLKAQTEIISLARKIENLEALLTASPTESKARS